MRANSLPSSVTLGSPSVSRMKPRSVSSTTMRSNVRASELVAAATFCWICSLSRSMRRYRSASRTFSSRSGNAMARVALQLLAKTRQFRVDVVVVRRATSPALGYRHALGGRPQRRRHVAAHPRLAVLDPFGQRHRAHLRRCTRVVRRRNPARPPVFGQHQRSRVVVVAGGLEDNSQSGAPPVGDVDDVAAAQRRQRVVGGPACAAAAKPATVPSPVREIAARSRAYSRMAARS